MRRRAKAAACANGLYSLVKGTGANIKMGEILIIVYWFDYVLIIVLFTE